MPKYSEVLPVGPIEYDVTWESVDRITMAVGYSRWRWLATVKAFWNMIEFRSRCQKRTTHCLRWE